MFRLLPRLGAAAVVILGAAGCGPQGPDLGPFGLVSGKVTYEGKPVAQGMVTFNAPATGHVGTANLEADGTFTMQFNGRPGLPVGEYQVSIRPPLTAKPSGNSAPASRNNLYDPNISKDIPMKYRYETSSGLVETVAEGENSFEFDLSAAAE